MAEGGDRGGDWRREEETGGESAHSREPLQEPGQDVKERTLLFRESLLL